MVPLLSQAAGAGGALLSTTHRCSLKSIQPSPPLFSKRRHNFSLSSRHLKPLSLANPSDSSSNPTTTITTASIDDQASTSNCSISISGKQNVPLDGAIQFEKPYSTPFLSKWGLIAALAGGDVAALLLFSAIGRFTHGFAIFDIETFKTADPFIAGWFLSAYILGGYGEEGRGKKGVWRAVLAATKSWSLGIPLGLFIKAMAIGRWLPTSFVVVTMWSTVVLLVGWRALLFSVFARATFRNLHLARLGAGFQMKRF